MVHSIEPRFTRSNRRAPRADARRVEILRAAARVFRDARLRRRRHARHRRRRRSVARQSLSLLPRQGRDSVLLPGPLARSAARRAAPRAQRAAVRCRVAAAAPRGRARAAACVDEVEGSAAHLEVDALPPRCARAIVAKRDRYERGVRALIAAGVRARRAARRPTRRRHARVPRRAELDGALVPSRTASQSPQHVARAGRRLRRRRLTSRKP